LLRACVLFLFLHTMLFYLLFLRIFLIFFFGLIFFFSSRRRHTRSKRDWSSDVCSSDLHRWLSISMRTPLATQMPSFCMSLPRIFFFYILCILIRNHWKTKSRLFVFCIMISYSRIYRLFICRVCALNRILALLFFWFIFFYFYFFKEKVTYTFLPIIRHQITYFLLS